MVTLDTAKLRKIAIDANAVARGPWECDREVQTDAPNKHDEFFAIDGAGNRMFGTENCDAGFSAIEIDYDEDWSKAWNEPARRVIEHVVAFQPTTVITLVDELDQLRSRMEHVERLLEDITKSFGMRKQPAESKVGLDTIREIFSKVEDEIVARFTLGHVLKLVKSAYQKGRADACAFDTSVAEDHV